MQDMGTDHYEGEWTPWLAREVGGGVEGDDVTACGKGPRGAMVV